MSEYTKNLHAQVAAPFAIPQVVRLKATGQLLITVERYTASKWGAAGYSCAPVNNRWTRRGYPDADLEAAPSHPPGGFDYDSEITPRAQGALPWEHAEPANLAITLSNIAACDGWYAYPHIGWVKKPGDTHQSWARLFLHRTQGGEFTGEAHALVYEGHPYGAPIALREAVIEAAVRAVHDRKAPSGDLAAAVLAMEAKQYAEPALPSAWLLSICKHEIIDSSTAEGRMRGWHPARCAKCGINLSVDSSD